MPQKYKFPSFQLYASDFTGSPTIAAMDSEQIGWYIMLLCYAWESDPCGTLPADLEIVRRLARADKESWDLKKGPHPVQIHPQERTFGE